MLTRCLLITDTSYIMTSNVVTDPTNWDAILTDCAAAGKRKPEWCLQAAGTMQVSSTEQDLEQY